MPSNPSVRPHWRNAGVWSSLLPPGAPGHSRRGLRRSLSGHNASHVSKCGIQLDFVAQRHGTGETWGSRGRGELICHAVDVLMTLIVLFTVWLLSWHQIKDGITEDLDSICVGVKTMTGSTVKATWISFYWFQFNSCRAYSYFKMHKLIVPCLLQYIKNFA